jgi:subtilisin family serine protease
MSLDFDRLLDAPTLHAALADARGQGIVVAVVDTGVDVTHPDLSGAVVRSIEVAPQGSLYVCRDLDTALMTAQQLDPVGHGTACAGILHALAPDAKIVSVRVIGAGAAGTGEQLLRGLEWVLGECEPRIHVANLSLGTTHARIAEPLRRLVDRAYFHGPVLVAAANNMGVPSFPAQFAALMAVDIQHVVDPLSFEYQESRPAELSARGVYVRAPKSGGGHQLWTGTSFACPHIAAIVARLLSINPSLTRFQIKTLLHALRANRD